MQPIPVKEGLYPPEVQLADVYPTRHTIYDPMTKAKSRHTYCNQCGSAYVEEDKCASCGLPVGNPYPNLNIFVPRSGLVAWLRALIS